MAGFLHDLFLSGGKLPRWLEFLALIPVTVLLGPLLFAGMAGLVMAFAGVSLGPRPGKAVALIVMVFLLAQMLAGLASLACLWVLLLGGMKAIRQRPALRAWVMILLVVGVADALHFLFSDPGVTKAVASSTLSVSMWTAVLGLPMLLGIRYVYLLLGPAERGDDGQGR